MRGRFLMYDITISLNERPSYITKREFLSKEYSEIFSPVNRDLLMLHLACTSLTYCNKNMQFGLWAVFCLRM